MEDVLKLLDHLWEFLWKPLADDPFLVGVHVVGGVRRARVDHLLKGVHFSPADRSETHVVLVAVVIPGLPLDLLFAARAERAWLLHRGLAFRARAPSRRTIALSS